jgi:molybdopterin converting factor small subunit
MKVIVNFLSLLKLKNAKSGDCIDVAEGTSIGKLLMQHIVEEEALKYIKLVVNGRQEDMGYILKDGDILTLIIPIGGG